MAEISVAGVFMPAILVWLIVAYVLNTVLRRLLAWSGLYRFVWHRSLFDLSIYVILLGGIVALAANLVGP